MLSGKFGHISRACPRDHHICSAAITVDIIQISFDQHPRTLRRAKGLIICLIHDSIICTSYRVNYRAVRLAHAEYSRNVFLATTHPDELKAEHRQSSYSLHNFDFRIPPVYLQDNVLEIVQGEYVSECYQCRRVFSRPYPPAIPSRPYCSACGARRS